MAARDGHLQGPACLLLAAQVGQLGDLVGVASGSSPRALPPPATRMGRRRRALAALRPRGPAMRRATSSRPSAPTTSMPSTRARFGDVGVAARTPAGGRRPAAWPPWAARRAPGVTLPSSESSPSSAHGPPEARICSDGEQDADGDGHVVGGAVLAPVGRREVHRDARERVGEAGVADGAADPLAGLGERRVRQAHDVERGQARWRCRPRHARAHRAGPGRRPYRGSRACARAWPAPLHRFTRPWLRLRA